MSSDTEADVSNEVQQYVYPGDKKKELLKGWSWPDHLNLLRKCYNTLPLNLENIEQWKAVAYRTSFYGVGNILLRAGYNKSSKIASIQGTLKSWLVVPPYC